MDEFSSRKSAGAFSSSRKASSGLAARNSAYKGDRNTQVCSRVGCASRMNFSMSNKIGCTGKAKTAKHPVGLSNISRNVVASSSKAPFSPSGTRKPNSDPQKMLPSHQGSNSESKPVIVSNSRVKHNALLRNNLPGEGGSSSLTPQSRQGKKTLPRTESIVPSAPPAFKQRSNGGRNGASTSKYNNLKNFKCNSINDVVPSDCSSSMASASSSILNLDRNKVLSRKRIGEAEGSLSTRGKKINGPPLDDRTNDRHVGGISIASSRRTRSSILQRDNNDTSYGIRRSAARTRLNQQEDRNRSRQMVHSNSPRRQINSNNGSLAAFDHGFGSSLLNMENVGHYNLNRVAQMLLALDGIEQDEEANYEQMLDAETNLLLGSLVFHDQHRDMRLDIDNMSYEELLALEERMGTVSTALSEEAIEKCVKKIIYNKAGRTGEGNPVGEVDGIKCCICQEEYDEGNKVGRLRCEHQYHVECIQKWLQLKNWCPICKASAAPSSSLE